MGSPRAQMRVRSNVWEIDRGLTDSSPFNLSGDCDDSF